MADTVYILDMTNETRRTSGPQTYCSCGARYTSSASAERRHQRTTSHREWYAKTYGETAAAAAFGIAWRGEPCLDCYRGLPCAEHTANIYAD